MPNTNVKASNLTSLSRLAFLAIHLSMAPWLSPLINVILTITNYFMDSLDGWLARRWGSTHYGEFMDISVDRIITLGYFSYHLWNHNLGYVFFLLILARDIVTDYISHFNMIGLNVTERHKVTKGFHYWVYSSKISKIINGLLQLLIAAAGFLGPVPLWLQAIFVITSYTRAAPTMSKARNLI